MDEPAQDFIDGTASVLRDSFSLIGDRPPEGLTGPEGIRSPH